MEQDRTLPTCPRCGYDLSGDVASWESSCPTSGTCSECGLRFSWSQVYQSIWVGPRWSFEHHRVNPAGPAKLSQSLKLRWLQTFLMAFHPLRLWRDMTVVHKFNPRRLASLAIVSLATFHALSVALVIGSAWIADQSVPDAIDMVVNPYPHGIWIECGRWGGSFVPIWAPLIFVCISLAMPLSMLILRSSFRRAKVRQAHLMRAAIMSLPLAHATTLALIAISTLIGCSSALGPQVENLMRGWGALLLFLPIVLAYGFWWRTFLAHYVHMSQPTLVAIVLLILSCMLVFTTAFSISVWT